MSDKPKLTKAEAGRLGGRIGGKLSRGGGRPRKYATASERQKAYLERKRLREKAALKIITKEEAL